MIRLIITSFILLASIKTGLAQIDTSVKKSDTILSKSDTVLNKSDTLKKTDTLLVDKSDTLKKTDTLSAVALQNDTLLEIASDPVATTYSKPKAGSGEVYKLKPAIDIPLTAIAAGWSLYAFPIIYDKKGISQGELENLNKNNINGFDRWAADVYHENAAKNSDLFFYAAMPLPLVLLIDREIRKDALKVGFLYLEAMSITGVFYTGSAYLWDRFRPLAYIKDPPPGSELEGDQKSGNARNSFLGGHPALVATSSFFVASVYADYHPDSKFKYVLYSAAAIVTGGTAYLRHRGGKHFPSDLIVGVTVGTLSGILVPRLHKNKAYSNSKVRIMPFTGESHGLHMVYKL